jgi:hypothetical protein
MGSCLMLKNNTDAKCVDVSIVRNLSASVLSEEKGPNHHGETQNCEEDEHFIFSRGNSIAKFVYL